ncbi:hypothetical protein [Lentzea sp. NPDC059081]|uniref:hypothetical protein n=1 Tax=Lentzea sp. NPDC059081 TaxID=3346719 RepID=UPI00367E9A49
MPFASGSRVTAAALNRITRVDLEATVSSDLTVLTSTADVPGASITLTTTQANTKVKVTASLDAEITGATDFLFGRLVVDGVDASGDVNFKVSGSNRIPVAKTWTITLGSVGSHTIKLRAYKTGTSNLVTIFSTHSKLSISGNGIS